MNILLIFLGAGFGGILRHWLSDFTHQWLGKGFPYGTLMVNVTGSFLMGVLFVLIMQKSTHAASELRYLVLIGLLGGYTTFSSFSIETMLLIESGAYTNAALNILLSVTLCITATWLGMMLVH